MGRPPLSPENCPAEEIVRLLRLEPLEGEGAFFRRTAEGAVLAPGPGRRAYSTIYSLLTPGGFSAMHRLAQDEVWCFHAGDPLDSLQLRPDGGGAWVNWNGPRGRGPAANGGARRHLAGARLAAGGRWALSSCLVAPEFQWSDFELGTRDELQATFPAFAEGIRALTRTSPPHGRR